MAILKITQKHHNRFNDPFPPAPSTIPFTQGSLFVNSKTLHSQEILPIGNDFQLSWSSNNGGYLSISHLSQPSRPIWSTIPGKAFVSAALADTEVAESRGSFLVKDRDVHLVCHHQTIDDIKVINPCDRHSEREVMNSPSGYLGSNQKSDIRDTHLPTLLITGRIFNTMKTSRKFRKLVMHSNMQLTATGPSASARYWVLFSQKTNGQVGFKVKTETPKIISRKQSSSTVSGIYRGFKKRLINRKGKFGWLWNVSRSRGFALASSAEEELAKLKKPESAEFNRVWLTYATDEDERFYGFGEQFSHMNLKGKKIPIFVQEQGIGRGDQPITFAANLVSYRAGGDWSTTYAPSPFYMTSKMRSIYLEGYDYTIFDLTIPDRVQIQIHGNSVDGRILHGNSPCELIERFTETIGRQPEIPEWIISGAIVGMQGGTEAVRHIWDELRAYDLPISAFWLQVIHLPCTLIKYRRSEELLLRWMELNSFTTIFRTHEGNKPSHNSQFYSNQRTLSHFARFAKVYAAWKFYRIQLVKEAAQKGLPVCRHLFLHYPSDEHVLQLSYQQFMVGSEILVVPVLDKGMKKVKAYFPVGETSSWQHIWTGKVFSEKGSEAWIEAPIGYPAVFIKVGSLIGETFLQTLKSFGIL